MLGAQPEAMSTYMRRPPTVPFRRASTRRGPKLPSYSWSTLVAILRGWWLCQRSDLPATILAANLGLFGILAAIAVIALQLAIQLPTMAMRLPGGAGGVGGAAFGA